MSEEYKVLKTMKIKQGDETVEAHIIDDSRVGEAAWSSLNSIERLCPPFSESGIVVQCEPVEGYSMTVQTEESATKVSRCGKNIANVLGYSAVTISSPDTALRLSNTAGTQFISATSGSEIEISGTAENPYFCFHFYHPFRAGDEITISFDFKVTANPAVEEEMMVIWNNQQKFSCVSKDEVGRRYLKATLTEEMVREDNWVMVVLYLSGQFGVFSNLQIEHGNTYTEHETCYYDEFDIGTPVVAISGVNTIWADSGEITVTGKADPVAIIEKLTNAIASLGSNV